MAFDERHVSPAYVSWCPMVVSCRAPACSSDLKYISERGGGSPVLLRLGYLPLAQVALNDSLLGSDVYVYGLIVPGAVLLNYRKQRPDTR